MFTVAVSFYAGTWLIKSKTVEPSSQGINGDVFPYPGWRGTTARRRMVWVQTALAREEERCVENSAEGL